jgi:hypothetical protein
VPTALRSAGLTVHTLADVFGEETAQETEDVAWINLAAQQSWVAARKPGPYLYGVYKDTIKRLWP